MKSIICRCEDITAADIKKAIDNGFTDIESIKRYTGLGTGVCQGKTCVHNLNKVLKEMDLIKEEKNITARPPIEMVEFKKLL